MTSGHLTQPPALGEATVRELRDALRGELVLPGDAAYDEARGRLERDDRSAPGDHRSLHRHKRRDRSDRLARSEGLTVAVRGGGQRGRTRPATAAS